MPISKSLRVMSLSLLLGAAMPLVAPLSAHAQTAVPEGEGAGQAKGAVGTDVAAPAPRLITTQLPRHTVPQHYDITFTPDVQNLRFSAQVIITLEVKEATNAITLQAADLTIHKATLTAQQGRPWGEAAVTMDPATQTATFTFSKPIKAGQYTLAIDYDGLINTQSSGLFALDYTASDGTQQRGLYSQFENSDARRFVPSWDEPFYKATFTLKAIVPDGQMAVSNLPVQAQEAVGEGKTKVTFGQSPRMSTYLLFFGLGDFERNTRDVGGTQVGVITKRGDLAQGDYALDKAAALLPWMNDYFGIAYPLPKMDHIAAPGRSQFFSAMENWGSIFYFENALLLDPKIASHAAREKIFTTVAHEMAHQWFGDLVTMSWWDDLWLNEGFASWLESRATQHFYPEWNPQLTALGGREAAMAQDAFVTTHPVITPIKTVEAASQAFDTITYSKGEAVIRMLEDYAGETAWRDGVRAYMQRYKYGNTVTDDLWREIERASGKPITQIAHDFTLQPGIPLVTATAQCSSGQTRLTLAQSEFSRDREQFAARAWQVPVRAAMLGGQSVDTLLKGQSELTLSGCAPVIVNAGQAGYYRVAYDKATFAALTKAIAQVQPVDQLGLLNDALALGLTGQRPMGDVFQLIRNLPDDASPQVIQRAAMAVATVASYMQGQPKRTASLAAFTKARFLPVLNRLGWEPKAGEAAVEGDLRGTLIQILGSFGERSVIAEAQRRFNASARNPSVMDPSVRVAILSVVAKNADAPTWTRLHQMAKAETSAQVRMTYYSLLGAVRDPALADRALALALSDELEVTTSPVILSAVAGEHPDKAFDFAMAHYDTVMTRLDNAGSKTFFPRLARGSSNPAMVGKIEAYMQAHVTPDVARPSLEAIALIQERVKVSNTRMRDVAAWLRAAGY